MSSGHRWNSTVAGSSGRARPCLAMLLVALMLISCAPLLARQASSDPWFADDGDMTRSVVWNFTDSSDYTVVNASVSGGFGSLQFINSTVDENTTADYMLGTGANIDLVAVPDSIVIDNASQPIQTLILQPGAEGSDNYIDEWFPNWSPPDGGDLKLNSMFDGTYGGSKRCAILMKFNLSAVPAGATVTDASLLLYQKGGRPDPIDYTIRALNKTWAENGVSWIARDPTHYWDTAGGEYSTEPFARGMTEDRVGWHTFNLTRLVDLWIRNAIPNYGFIIVPKPVPGDSTKTYSDCEITNKPEQRPMLAINYTVGSVSGGYESRALGDGMNSTYTLASWSAGTYSKATDEFDSAGLSQKWQWMSDPRLTGGQIDLNKPGWLNITGSQFSDLAAEFNFLYQNITGDFRFETSLRQYFIEASMGAGILLRTGDQSWLSLYKKGVQGGGQIVAEFANGTRNTLAAVSWPSSTAFLRMERVGATYSMLASQDGANWSLIRTITPKYDFTKRVSLGLCLFSGGSAVRPVVEFGYARIEPLGQAITIELRARTGNSTVLSDPSWTAWTGPLVPSSGSVVGHAGRFIQYQATLNTSFDWYSPRFSGFECHFERYSQSGTITMSDISPPALSMWQTLAANQSLSIGRIEYSYSTDHGAAWVSLGNGTNFSIPLTESSMMIKISLTTYDTLLTPSVDSIELVYLISHAGFYVSAPETVVAGQVFSVYIEPKDSDNNTAGWTGVVSINARDALGMSNASSELYVTSGGVPAGGHLTVANERYDFAETIRVIVSGGGATGISNPIIVTPGPIDHIFMEPNVTRIPEDNNTAFTARGYDALGNQITGFPTTWHVDLTLGFLNTTTGPSVMLTTGSLVSGGFLNVTIQGMTLSRYIEVAPLQLPPTIDSVLPTQTKTEDFGAWTFDLSPYVSDREDSLSELKWYAVNESVVAVSGENRTGNMIVTFTTIQNLNGLDTLEVRVVDTSRMMARASLTVNITPVNDLPRIDEIEPLVVRYDNPYQYNLEFYVHDVETPVRDLTISVDSASAPYVHVDGLWLTMTYPQSMNGTQQTVLVTVTDEDNAHSETLILVTISDDFVPRTKGSLPNLEMFQGDIVISYFDLDDYFTDPDGDMVIYTYGNTHVSVVIQANNTVDFYAPSSWYGSEYIVFRANDSSGARAESAMVVEVIAVNQPPVISGVPDIVVKFGREFSFDLTPYVRDLDDDEGFLTVTTNDVHVWAEGLQLTILYPSGMIGNKVPVELIVSDGFLTDSWTMNVTISTDAPPTIVISPPDFSFDEDDPKPYPEAGHINDYFTDEDGDSLTYFAFVSTANMTVTLELDNGNWTVVFNPEENWNGLTHLTLRAVDGAGALVETTVQLIVNSVADRPLLSLPESFSVTAGVHTILDITSDIDDPDSVLADFRFVVAPQYEAYVSVHNGIIVFVFPDDYLDEDEESRDIQISITVFDQDNLFSTDTITITLSRQATPSTSNPILWLALLATAAAASILFVFAVIRRRKPFVVHDMMLIHNDGFLISRQATPVPGEIDEQILSGMLTAVLNFVEDSMAKDKESLTTFGFREYQVMVKRGEKMFAAVVFDGDLPKEVDANLDEFIKKFEKIYRKKLVDWSGDIDTDFAGVDVLINAWIRDNSRKARKNASMPWKTGEQPQAEDQTAK